MSEKIQILYCSSFCSERMIDYLLKNSKLPPLLSIQKFHNLFTRGLVDNNCNVTALSVVPTGRKYNEKIYWNPKNEVLNEVQFKYIPFLNIYPFRQVMVGVFTFFYVLGWGLLKDRNNSVITVDITDMTIAISSLIAGKIVGVKTSAIVTDLPDAISPMKFKQALPVLVRFAKYLSKRLLFSCNHFVLLTEHMNEVVNPKRKPFMIMEGLVDLRMQLFDDSSVDSERNRILLYSGGIYEAYGIKMLIEAFMMLEQKNLRLHIYGDGEMRKDMGGYMKQDSRIVYFGVVPNHELVQKQISATLLINPRFSNQEFTKYSFPSKIMEYLVSGTPVIATFLDGMPSEYRQFMYVISQEDVVGLSTLINSVISKPRNELIEFGSLAKEYVIKNKNNVIQAQRYVNDINEMLHSKNINYLAVL